MAILAPLQEGMQALPSEEVANEGARALRKVNLSDSRPSCETSTWRGRALTPARHWLRRWAPFRRLRRRTSAPRTPTRHMCSTTLLEVSSQAGPGEGAILPPQVGDIKEKCVQSQNAWHQEALLEEMIWWHRPPLRVPPALGGDQPRTWTRRRASCPCSSGR